MTVEQLHNEYGKYLLTCLRFCGIPEQECEDVRQDIYLRLLKSGQEIEQPKGFCSHTARNAAKNWRRDNKRLPFTEGLTNTDESGNEYVHPEISMTDMSKWESVLDNPNPERITQALELAAIYECAPGITAHSLIAGLLYGLNRKEIGAICGVSHQTIDNWLKEWYIWVNVQTKEQV